MESKPDIYKAGGILLNDRKLLVGRAKGKQFFVAPGGKLEPGETPERCLARELQEEFQIQVEPENITEFGIFYADAAGKDGKTIKMDVFMVENWSGEPFVSGEIEEMRWVSSTGNDDIDLGSVVEHDILPKLKELDLVD